MTASGDQICFFFIVNIEKIKIRITKKTSTKVHRQNYYPGHVFSWVLLNARTTEPPTNRPLTIYPPTHRPTDPPTTRPPTQRLAESIIILERLTIETYSFCRTQTWLGKHIAKLRYIIQKIYWFP